MNKKFVTEDRAQPQADVPMTKGQKSAVRCIVTLAIWFGLIGLSLASCLRIKGYPLTPTATAEIRPGWEGISLGIFVGTLAVEYLVCAVVVGAVFRAIPGSESAGSEKRNDEQAAGADPAKGGPAQP